MNLSAALTNDEVVAEHQQIVDTLKSRGVAKGTRVIFQHAHRILTDTINLRRENGESRVLRGVTPRRRERPEQRGATMLEQVQIDVAVSRRTECGEGPLWDPAADAVHWVDIIRGEILTTDFTTGETGVVAYPGMVGAAAPRAGGGFVAAVTTGFVGITADGIVTQRVDCLREGVRMNDAKTDPRGVYWAGSCASDFAEGKGGLWRLDENWEATLTLAGLTQPNGLGWSPSGDVFYLVETQARRLYSFAFDPATSTLDPTPTLLIDENGFLAGLPDGLAVDEAGHLWIAMFAGSAVQEFTPEGELVRTVAIPTIQTTSCMFVGPDRDELWVTSAGWQLSPEDDADAGSTFRVTGLGAVGLPTPPFRG